MSKPSIHVISHVGYCAKWIALRNEGENIISSWIDQPIDINDTERIALAKKSINEALGADYTILYYGVCWSALGDFAFAQVGAALANLKYVLIVGCDNNSPLSRTLLAHPYCLNTFENLSNAFNHINKNR